MQFQPKTQFGYQFFFYHQQSILHRHCSIFFIRYHCNFNTLLNFYLLKLKLECLIKNDRNFGFETDQYSTCYFSIFILFIPHVLSQTTNTNSFQFQLQLSQQRKEQMDQLGSICTGRHIWWRIQVEVWERKSMSRQKWTCIQNCTV